MNKPFAKGGKSPTGRVKYQHFVLIDDYSDEPVHIGCDFNKEALIDAALQNFADRLSEEALMHGDGQPSPSGLFSPRQTVTGEQILSDLRKMTDASHIKEDDNDNR